MGELLIFVAGCMLGALIAAIVSMQIFYKKRDKNTFGVLHVETSDPDENYLFLELETSVETVMKQDYVRLKVDTKNYISQ